MSLYIIAEAGSCHEQSYTRALNLIHEAKRSGADAVKFQYWSSPDRMRERRHVDTPDAYQHGSILRTWLPLLSDYAHSRGIEFLCTAYLPEDIEVVAPHVDRFKVASFEATPEFVALHGGYGKHVVVSLGMQGFPTREWAPALSALAGSRAQWLHCVSAYPCPMAEANLGGISGLRGYSDHTRCIYTGGFAVSAGADILEVHFRLEDTKESCPDYVVALSPTELTEYIRLARLASVMRGDGVKKPQPSEIPMMKYRVQ